MSIRKDQAFAALIAAEEQFITVHRVVWETRVKLAKALPAKLSDRCIGQLQGYFAGLDLYPDVASLFELPAWRHALKWAGGSRVAVNVVAI